jgi:hypothetical protein
VKKSINGKTYKKLSINIYVKNSLDEYLKNIDKIQLTWEQWKDLLFEYCYINNEAPSRVIIYKNENLGNWLKNQKAKIKSKNDDFYKILSENEIVKKELDRFLSNKK